MAKRLRRVLILDTDPGALIALQQVLEQASFDTTITWDETKARRLLAAGSVLSPLSLQATPKKVGLAHANS